MTLSNNLETISDTFDDIHDAIVAKGVTPSGNITTYATAIGNIGNNGFRYDYTDCVITETNPVDLKTGDTSNYFTGCTQCTIIMKTLSGLYDVPIAISIYKGTNGYMKLAFDNLTYDSTTGTLTFYGIGCHRVINSSTGAITTDIAPSGTISIQSDTMKSQFSNIQANQFS